jgi:hypothetical protein
MVVKRRSFAQARKAAGYTQESLAERLGVDRTTVARWELGTPSRNPGCVPRSPKRSDSRCASSLSSFVMSSRRDIRSKYPHHQTMPVRFSMSWW